jgi:molybdate/tungstate transport system substrate-binding protein
MTARVKALLAVVLIVIAATGSILYYARHKASATGGARERQLIVCTAGSMALPLKSLAAEFGNSTGVKILLKPMGSVDIVRRITGLGMRCDIVVLADYRLIPMYLYPNYTSWYVVFASNKMVVAWSSGGPKTLDDVIKDMESGEVKYGFSDPNRDPCGYRAVGSIGLLSLYEDDMDILEDLVIERIPGSHYNLSNGSLEIYIPATFTPRDGLVVRPKSVELLSLLESGELDYAILYENEAVEHHLHYIELPPIASLGDPSLAQNYSRVVVHILSGSPSERPIEMAPIAYGVTVTKNSPEEKLAIEFVAFLLRHAEALKSYGFTPLEELLGYGSIPGQLGGLVHAAGP